MGAGLPILNTVQSLAMSGDKIQNIEGILSGTLSYIFNTYDGSMPFSEVVKQAKEVRFIHIRPLLWEDGCCVSLRVSTAHWTCWHRRVDVSRVPTQPSCTRAEVLRFQV